jgi:hypothetical protein
VEFEKRKVKKMQKRFVVSAIALAVLAFSPGVHAQAAAAPVAVDGWYLRPAASTGNAGKPAPAPRHDISGIWEPANGSGDGIQATGTKAMPSDGKPEHELPYTPAGRQAFLSHKPGWGVTQVPAAFVNDPVDTCDPPGFPRLDLSELRTTEIMQNDRQVVLLYKFSKLWRSAWLDREVPTKVPEPKWFGYSAAKWVDDTTLVVTTVGLDDRAWLDNAGRPQSADVRVEEQFHRVDHDHMELTVTVEDPKMYTKPWVALNKFPFRLLPPDFEMREQLCVPSETEAYNKLIADPASGVDDSEPTEGKKQ